MKKISQLLLVCLVLLGSMLLPLSAAAQVHHRHHRLKVLATGVAAYAIAKHTGKHKAHKNFFQRHPVATGVGAGLLMHHHLKHHHH